MKKIFPIIVLYKERLEKGNTYKTLISLYTNGKYMLYDNSPSPLYEEGELPTHIVYIYDKNNGGVTVAYNKGAEYARKNGYQWVLLLDQDTVFENNYAEKLEYAIMKYPQIKVFAPQIYYNRKSPFSPSAYTFGIAKALESEPGIYSLRKIFPVNSGTCIATDSFMLAKGYDTNIKLDFADMDFFFRLSRKEHLFCLIDSKAYQSFSGNETDKHKLYRRYRIYINDAKNVRKRNIKDRVFFFYVVLRHTIALTFKTKSTTFLRYFMWRYLF